MPGFFVFQHCVMQSPVYHYTTGDRLLGILAAGEIRPATAHVVPPEIPAVWLSTASAWEKSATKGVIKDGVRRLATLTELVLVCGCLARIRINPSKVDLIPNPQLQAVLHIPGSVFRRLCTAGAEMGADPAEWLAVTGAIPLAAFRRVEIAFETRPVRWVEARPCGVPFARPNHHPGSFHPGA